MANGLRLLVCGGRDFADKRILDAALSEMQAKHGIAAIIQGAAAGADTLAAEWGRSKGVPVEAFPADWETHRRAAGPIRNKQMLDEGRPDAVLAFPGGRGTANMVRQAEAAGVRVWKVAPAPSTLGP